MTVKLWDVYRVPNCRHSDPPKDKFVVIACFDPGAHGFFINSEVNAYYRLVKQEHCFGSIPASRHPFLRYDSFIDCTTLFPYLDAELVDLVGRLSAEAQSNVRKSVQACKILKRRYKDLILNQV